MRRLRQHTGRLLIGVCTVSLAVAVGALGDLPEWAAPAWWWWQSWVGTLSFYFAVVVLGTVSGWGLKQGFNGLARYDRFDRLGIEDVKRCDVLVLPLATLNETHQADKAIKFEPDREALSDQHLKELSEQFRGTSLEVGWNLFTSFIAQGFTPDLVLLQGTTTGKPPEAGAPDLTLLPAFRHIEAKGIARADGTRYTPTVYTETVIPYDLMSCFDGLRRVLDKIPGKRVLVMDVTSATAAMSVASAMLGITNGQLLASTTRGTPTVFYDARVRLVSPFTAMSGS